MLTLFNLNFKIMKWYKLFNDNIPQRKCADPLTALAIGSSIVGGIGNLFGQSSANDTNLMIARQNREWQSGENQKARDYQTEMWERQNEYNTPANQRQLLVDAGYNPFVLQQNGSTSAAGGLSAPGMQSSPNQPHIEPINPLGGVSSLMNAIALSNQKEQVDSTVESNKANIVKTLSEAAIDAYDKLGQKGFTDLMSKISPILKSLTFEGSRSDIMFNEYLKNNLSQRYNQDMDSLNKELQYNLGSKYSEQQIQSALEKVQYDISEIVGRLNTMNIQNEALMKKTAADCVESFASAFKLRKEGDKFVADAKTVNLLRDALHRIIKGEANIKEVESYFAEADKMSSSDLIGFATSSEGRARKSKAYQITLEQKSSDLIRACDKVLGEYFNVNFSYGDSKYSPTFNQIHPSVYSTTYLSGQ